MKNNMKTNLGAAMEFLEMDMKLLKEEFSKFSHEEVFKHWDSVCKKHGLIFSKEQFEFAWQECFNMFSQNEITQ